MNLKVDHLVGFEFNHGKVDCLTTIRRFYWDNFDIPIPNFARPENWWNHGLDLYGQNYHRLGFRAVHTHPSEYRPGDLILMAFRSKVANHAGVLLEGGNFLHHFAYRTSCVEPYTGRWRDLTVGVFRHKDVDFVPENATSNLMEHLPQNIREKIDAAAARVSDAR
ncbi:hypothetical protein IZ6_25090 [Terrihabitans soli]|uniref:NlpC/P60 domain-containing protein n=1 Tax=Terrihabitans soli TaxID=708113 RepID=A0A6S6QMR4_9HYPH|nr:NlpC/P60 family protein [Terrihabitans soli]BCJ91774.1 hypothetical protein IZ6_25090 [Terrihabitans soli]